MENRQAGLSYSPGGSFREHQRFLKFARDLVCLPLSGEGPEEYLLSEAQWIELESQVPDPEAWLMALSAATGIYFFPSREFVASLVRYLKRLNVTRLLEGGAGRGYLTAALAPRCAAAGITFAAIDSGEGEFVSGLPGYPGVAQGNVFSCVREFKPQVVLYAWPPPGQSLAAICQEPFVHYLMIIGEAGGGVTGAREDWKTLPHLISPALSRYGRGRSGASRHRVTIFYGALRRSTPLGANAS